MRHGELRGSFIMEKPTPSIGGDSVKPLFWNSLQDLKASRWESILSKQL